MGEGKAAAEREEEGREEGGWIMERRKRRGSRGKGRKRDRRERK